MKALWQQCIDIFLPAGYPHSVTDDYLEYQIYDSLQAFSSSIAGLLSSRAVLEGELDFSSIKGSHPYLWTILALCTIPDAIGYSSPSLMMRSDRLPLLSVGSFCLPFLRHYFVCFRRLWLEVHYPFATPSFKTVFGNHHRNSLLVPAYHPYIATILCKTLSIFVSPD